MGLLIYAGRRTHVIDIAQKVDGLAVETIADLPNAIIKLKRGGTVVCGPWFTTGWRAPHGTVIVFHDSFLVRYPVNSAEYMQANAREGI